MAAEDGAQAPPDETTTLALLARTQPLARGSAASLVALCARSVERTFAPGEVILKQGEMGHAMYLIRSGKVHIVREAPRGARLPLAELGPGQVFGEIAVLHGLPRTATVLAVEPTSCVEMPAAAVLDFLESNGAVAVALLRVVSARLNETEEILHPTQLQSLYQGPIPD